ncbi:MAG: DUF1232 domain-containing protein [Planctomycetes bacterium]|nr:DUF1232 domain-containing protein [Planctomycetota bacterium]MCC8116878.1 DUF1232 domain-containing protein [Planctomycetota bacterium]MCD7896814.1 DUF1232 domain-containing protein [Planctomycetaceae bacterium]
MDLAGRAKMLWDLFTKGGMTRTDKLVLVLALLYTLSPLDIIPDVIPIAGFLDDLIVVIMSLRHVTNKNAGSNEKDDPSKPVDAKVIG